MFDGLLGRNNFKKKCKSAVTRTMTRLEVIKKRRNAMQMFLKKDIAELLMRNLHLNAYGRVEGLYMELNLSSCYDYVEECCTCVAAHLKEMQKQSECPEQCKVAAASLIYAAARFADLPELRDLRNLFNDKYGKALEPFVSKEFREKLKPNPPTMEMRLQLMQEIAQEFSVPWDPKHLQHQLQSPTNFTPSNSHNDDHNLFRNKSDLIPGKQNHNNNADKHLINRRNYSYSEFQENAIEDQNQNSERKSRPRSVRTKFFAKQYSVNATSSGKRTDDLKERKSSSARIPHENRRGFSQDDDDEEEDMIDELLIHYSTNKLAKTPTTQVINYELPLPPGKRRYLFS